MPSNFAKLVTSVDMEPLASRLPSTLGDSLTAIAEALYVQLCKEEQKCSPENLVRCADIAIRQVLLIASMFGGHNLYIRFIRSDFAQRNEEIKREWNGKNLRVLATKYELSEQSIRNIVSTGSNTPPKRTKRADDAGAYAARTNRIL